MNHEKRIFALGFFDGVHLGHQALLRECRRLAGELGCEAAAITFDSHPKTLFTPQPPLLVNSRADRLRLLKEYGIGQVYSFPVTQEVMSTPWQAFLEQLTEYGAGGFVCGHDFRFGFRGEGNSEKLARFCRERGLPCVIVPEQTLGGVRVSSSHIRELIAGGDMEQAVGFLGHPHILSGTVVPGHQLGRRLGIPTANLRLPEGVAAPKFGVYACCCRVDGVRYPAVTNVGTRPTVSGSGITVEPWILDYDGDLYGREIILEFYKFLRPEQRFPSLEALQAAIRNDAARVRQYLAGETVKDS